MEAMVEQRNDREDQTAYILNLHSQLADSSRDAGAAERDEARQQAFREFVAQVMGMPTPPTGPLLGSAASSDVVSLAPLAAASGGEPVRSPSNRRPPPASAAAAD